MEDEYKMLRDEIMFNLDKIHMYISLASTVGLALLAYIIDKPNNIILIFLFLFVLSIAECRIYGITKNNTRISTYMEVFLESKIKERNWETYSYFEIDEASAHSIKYQTIFRFISGSNTICFLISYAVLILNCYILSNNWSCSNFLFSIINWLLLVFLAHMALNNRGGNKLRDHYIEHWNKVKEKKEQSDNIRDENVHVIQ